MICTGACGFIGSHLVEALVAAGHDVTAFCQYSARGERGWHTADCRTVMGDVRDLNCVAGAMAGHEITFHLAALIGIPYSYVAHTSYVDTNITGTLNVLQAAIPTNNRIIITSTSEVYGTAQTVPMTEDHPLHAQSPYAATKIAADQLALSFHRSFGTPVSILRPFNTYGPRQSARAVVTQIIMQLLDGDNVRLGNIQTVRDMLYVDDTVAAFVAMMDNFTAGEVVHVGTGYGVNVAKIVEIVGEILGRTPKIMYDGDRVRPDASEVAQLICDPRKAAETIKWSAKVSLVEGLQRTCDWFRENRGKFPQGYAT